MGLEHDTWIASANIATNAGAVPLLEMSTRDSEEVGLTSGYERPKRLVTLRREDNDFVVSFYPEDVVAFRHVEPISLRKVCTGLRWKIISDGASANDMTLSAF